MTGHSIVQVLFLNVILITALVLLSRMVNAVLPLVLQLYAFLMTPTASEMVVRHLWGYSLARMKKES
jgi:hypothetical protein